MENLIDLFQKYLNVCKYTWNRSPETIKGSKEAFKLFSKVMPEITMAGSISEDLLNEFIKRLRVRERIVGRNTIKVGIMDSTVKSYANRLSHFFEWLVDKNLLEVNPVPLLKLPYPQYTDSRALKEEDVRKIYAAIALHSKDSLMLKRDTMMVSLLYFCGVRKGEFISLRVTDVDKEKKLLTVRKETSKSRKTRTLPIHPTLLFHLEEYFTERNKRSYRTDSLIVSTCNDRGLSRDGLKHWVEKIKKISGVKFHLHRFRHTFACNLGDHDVGAVKIQKLMGHAKLEMTETYLRSINSENLRNDINKLCI